MVSLLDKKLKNIVAKAFKGRLTKGTFRREVPGELDPGTGDPLPATPTLFAFEGIRENFSAYYKANFAIPETDIAILVLQGSLKPTTVIVKEDQDALVFLKTPWNRWHKVRKVLEIDPAGATARLQCYEVPAPL